MKSLWNDTDAKRLGGDPLALRVYTSRLLGREPALVLHGGGNTSVKVESRDVFGEREDLIYVKGTGWDLAAIEAPGFAPVRLRVLERLAEMERLSDAEMVRLQRSAMTDPAAPTPSVEAILHAIIPFAYVDHTHADSVVTITNTPGGDRTIRDLYGERALVVPYVMPGFILAKKVRELTRDIDWARLEGIVLLKHGVFTFASDARESYERMIRLVGEAEEYLERRGAARSMATARGRPAGEDLVALARLRRAVARERGGAVVAMPSSDEEAVGFSTLPKAAELASRGPLTPDHVIRTKPKPVIVSEDIESAVTAFAAAYGKYFEHHARPGLVCLDPAPRWALRPGHGTVAFGRSTAEARVVSDIVRHTLRAIQCAERLGGWKPLNEKDVFDIEYWELEQAKLKKASGAKALAGKVAIVTGAASGIGLASASSLTNEGAVVAGLDVDRRIEEILSGLDSVGFVCDVTQEADVARCVADAVRRFGGIDILVSNAGTFPKSESIETLGDEAWNRSLAINLTSHRILLKACIPYLRHGVDPAVVIIGSKNVPAPGYGAAAYSAAKAGLTQLARVAALELGRDGVRVNVIHPNNVFDTAIWTPEVLEERARRYGLSVEEYKKKSVLGLPVTSADVASMVCAMAGPAFAKTTGAQVPVDGGNERVI